MTRTTSTRTISGSVALVALLAAATAQAQTAPPPGTPNAVVEREGNQVGGGTDRVITRDATGAGTIETDSAAGGNAGQPSRRVPQGSGSGSGGNN